MDLKEEFVAALQEKLDHRPEEAVSVLHNPKYSDVIENSSWEIVPRLCANLTEKNRLENLKLYNCVVELLYEIARNANPEDMLFEFVEQAEKKSNTLNFIVILKAIKIILIRLPQRRGVAIGWSCSAIIHHLASIPLPHNTKLEDDQQMLMLNDSKFIMIENIYQEIIEFYTPFVKEIESDVYSIPENHIDIYKDSILKTLLKLFGRPLINIFLDNSKAKRPFLKIAENVINLVVCIEEDLLSFLDFIDTPRTEESNIDCEYSITSLGVFYYVILVEGILSERIPCVYSSGYLLKQLIWPAMSLMKSDCINVQWIGLSLAENILNRMNQQELTFKKINKVQSKEFAELCVKIMVYSESRRNREKAVPIFRKFLRIFDPRGRYYMLLSMQDINEPGFIGYLATNTKDFVSEALANKNSEEMKYFTGKCLNDLIKKYCFLPNDSETDLVRYSDQIIPSLNLLRYLILRDKNKITGFFDIIPLLNKTYFKPLKKAVELSKAHYELQKREMNQSAKLDATSSTVTVSGVQLPCLSIEQKYEIIDGALNIFDLIDSILTRVIECVDVNKS